MRTKQIGLVVLVFAAALIAFLATGTPVECSDDQVVELKTSIQTLQPRVDDLRAMRLAATFADAADQTELDAKLLVAMAMRESSFDPFVERLERRGTLGEGGLMQIHGVALRLRPRHCSKALVGAECQITTGARWLAWTRDKCGGSTARWVGAYGMRACPTEESARRHHSVLTAKAYYDEIGGSAWVE